MKKVMLLQSLLPFPGQDTFSLIKAQRAGNIRYIGLSQAGRMIRGNYMDKNRKKLFINIGITVAVIIIAAILGAIVGELLLDNLI